MVRSPSPEPVRHPASADDACSVLFDEDETSAYGTAARASSFVVLEQDGPWGRDAATESHLPPSLGRTMAEKVSAVGGRFMLMRHPGRHADAGGTRIHRVLLAASPRDPTQAWLMMATLTDPGALEALDTDALAAADRDAVRGSLAGHPGVVEVTAADPTVLVCTNGRRDVCCAVRGRPVAAAVARDNPDQPDIIWEVSHTGGHRFAPTAVLLPWGVYLARLTDGSANDALRDAQSGRLPTDLLGATHDRGRSALPADQQTAESAVRALIDDGDITALSVDPDGIVRHRDGRAWLVQVTRSDRGRQRPESCGKAPVDVHAWEVREITLIDTGHHQP